jgi:signal transduction histidine kinase
MQRNAQVDRLTELIRSLLDTTRISEGQLSLSIQEFDINTLINERIDEIKHTAEKHRLLFNTKGSLYVKADKERIGQVLVNLMSNAIKYSPKGGDITINAAALNDGVQVSVHDTGVGISSDMKDKIFDRFYRARNPQIETFPGMGLGLYITAAIMRRHEGKLWVDSKAGKGSTFYFFLPYR